MSLFLSSCFSFQTRADLVLVYFYYNAAVRHFLKTFKKFAGKWQWCKPILANLKLFTMDTGKGVFLSVFRTPFYGCSKKGWKQRQHAILKLKAHRRLAFLKERRIFGWYLRAASVKWTLTWSKTGSNDCFLLSYNKTASPLIKENK